MLARSLRTLVTYTTRWRMRPNLLLVYNFKDIRIFRLPAMPPARLDHAIQIISRELVLRTCCNSYLSKSLSQSRARSENCDHASWRVQRAASTSCSAFKFYTDWKWGRTSLSILDLDLDPKWTLNFKQDWNSRIEPIPAYWRISVSAADAVVTAKLLWSFWTNFKL